MDTSGQRQFNFLIQSYLNNASIVFIVYDVSKRSTFLNVVNWLNIIKKNQVPIIVLCGNKIDLFREVSENEGREFASKAGLLFFECSAKTKQNIYYMFYSSVVQLPILGINDNNVKAIWVKKIIEKEEGKSLQNYSIRNNFIYQSNNQININNNIIRMNNNIMNNETYDNKELLITKNNIEDNNEIENQFNKNIQLDDEKQNLSELERKLKLKEEECVNYTNQLSEKNKKINELIFKLDKLEQDIKGKIKSILYQNNPAKTFQNIMDELNEELNKKNNQLINEPAETKDNSDLFIFSKHLY